jgi:hypothetical protein
MIRSQVSLYKEWLVAKLVLGKHFGTKRATIGREGVYGTGGVAEEKFKQLQSPDLAW